MPRRTGTTLIEVLIAIFVMAIGMIALLTLFPIGALRMARAIQDDKCASAAANASAAATVVNIRNDPLVVSPPWLPGGPVDAFTGQFTIPPGPFGDRKPADPDGPSYPVYVDPFGVRFSVGNTNSWLAGYQGYILRSSTSFTYKTFDGDDTRHCDEWFSLLDDYIFDGDENSLGTGGKPFNFGTTTAFPVIHRNINYTWAYLLQRPRSSDPSIVTCSVVVYNKRPLASAGGLTLAEYHFDATFETSNNTITLTVPPGTALPNIRPGDWLLDGTRIQGQTYGTCHGFFYRVVGITEVSSTIVVFEVQQPIRGFQPTPTNTRFFGTAFVLEGVADVYERGVDRKPN